jgi:hypothetical protein
MDLSKLDFNKGKAFSSKVVGALGSKVCNSGAPLDRGFLLLVSFSRNIFRLTKEPVSICLQSVLGGQASDFKPFLMEEQIFQFSVSSKNVAFMVLALSPIAEDLFKLAFFLCNDSGFHHALRFAKVDSGTSFSWEPACKKKSAVSSFSVAKSPRRSSRAHFGHLRSSRSVRLNGARTTHLDYSYDHRREMHQSNSYSRPSYAQFIGIHRPPLSGANTVPIGKVHFEPFNIRGSQVNSNSSS